MVYRVSNTLTDRISSGTTVNRQEEDRLVGSCGAVVWAVLSKQEVVSLNPGDQ